MCFPASMLHVGWMCDRCAVQRLGNGVVWFRDPPPFTVACPGPVGGQRHDRPHRRVRGEMECTFNGSDRRRVGGSMHVPGCRACCWIPHVLEQLPPPRPTHSWLCPAGLTIHCPSPLFFLQDIFYIPKLNLMCGASPLRFKMLAPVFGLSTECHMPGLCQHVFSNTIFGEQSIQEWLVDGYHDLSKVSSGIGCCAVPIQETAVREASLL